MTDRSKPLIFITGASGNIGSSLAKRLSEKYRVVGFDRHEADTLELSYRFDLTSAESVHKALEKARNDLGSQVAAVIHLAAFFDFTGEDSPLYHKVNEQGTANLLEALKVFQVERFIYSSTMLVHEPSVPGSKITEKSPLAPGWAYPQSKLATEEIIRKQAGDMPYTLLRLAGLYDDWTAVPTLSHQIVRIYERTLKSHLYAGDMAAGQAVVHRDDMLDAFVRTVDRRSDLPSQNVILVGEDQVLSYEALQNRIGQLLHGEPEWFTTRVPDSVAKLGAWAEEKAEPLVPDDFDHGEKPFIRPFMIDMASDHYELELKLAEAQLGWRPTHKIYDELESLIDNLKRDPVGWYRRNGITPPDWMTGAADKGHRPNALLQRYEQHQQTEHRQNIWAPFLNMGLGAWLLSGPSAMGYALTPMGWSDLIAGVLLLALAGLCLSPRFGWARWGCGLIGLWLLFAPLAFWTSSATAYLNGTLVGALVLGLALLVRPSPGVSPLAAESGPTIPIGWSLNPSSWFQRAPIIFLAFIGFFISRYLTAYQLGHIDGIWEPFFTGSMQDARNGTEEIITSSVSEAWPVPDAGIGAMTYMLEILTGLMGSVRRWRTMPWLVTLFGLMIVPMGVVSITFIIIQPLILGTWCTLCLIAAVAMLVQIPYSLDELVASGQFLRRRWRAGRPFLKIFFVGDTDDGQTEKLEDNFQQPPSRVVKEIFGGGVNVPWNLGICLILGAWLMSTRISLGNTGGMANWDHLIGALVITVSVCALAEVGRVVRWLNIPLGAVLLVTPFIYQPGLAATILSLLVGLAIMVLTIRRGPVRGEYNDWIGAKF